MKKVSLFIAFSFLISVFLLVASCDQGLPIQPPGGEGTSGGDGGTPSTSCIPDNQCITDSNNPNCCSGQVHADNNCPNGQACGAETITCGNGICETGEDTSNCQADCQQQTTPTPAPTCIGAGTVSDGSCSLTDGTDCCNGGNYVVAYTDCVSGYMCGTAPAVPTTPACGNSACETGEDSITCPADCPITP